MATYYIWFVHVIYCFCTQVKTAHVQTSKERNEKKQVQKRVLGDTDKAHGCPGYICEGRGKGWGVGGGGRRRSGHQGSS